VITNFNADSSGMTSDGVIDRLLEATPVRQSGDEIAPAVARAFA
jgi:MoxR-like ATPase